uniref:ATP synthase complex subunit 8 n=1 Tax=Sceloporus grammicus TaxID=36306 RepID=A0A4P3AKE7_SCEGA|nr:TPA_asm: ATPase subunit 8 [Sceloporus grammicus]
MPQLSPSPWFLIMLMVWATLMVIFLNKVLAMLYPNIPTDLTPETKHPASWTWPWH